jgi:excisionase family DNA binding protein
MTHEPNVETARWLTPAEAAEWIGISRSRLYVLARANEIPHARLPGRGIRFNQGSLARWLTSLERGGDKA